MSSPEDPSRKQAYGPPEGVAQPAPQQPAPYGPPSPYGAPTPDGPPSPHGAPTSYGPPEEVNSKAVVALVLAGASFLVVPFVGAIVALVLGTQASGEIARSGGRQTGTGLVTAARIAAWTNIALSVVAVVAVSVVVAVVVAGG